MGRMSQDEISVGLFDECKRLQQANAALETRLAEVRKVCAEAYQWAGAYGAPVEVLDNLSDAANGDVIRHKTILPIMEPDHITRLAESEKARQEVEKQLEAAHQLLKWVCGAEYDAKLIDRLAALQEENAKVQAVIEAARVWAKSYSPTADCSDRDLRHAVEDLDKAE